MRSGVFATGGGGALTAGGGIGAGIAGALGGGGGGATVRGGSAVGTGRCGGVIGIPPTSTGFGCGWVCAASEGTEGAGAAEGGGGGGAETHGAGSWGAGCLCSAVGETPGRTAARVSCSEIFIAGTAPTAGVASATWAASTRIRRSRASNCRVRLVILSLSSAVSRRRRPLATAVTMMAGKHTTIHPKKNSSTYSIQWLNYG